MGAAADTDAADATTAVVTGAGSGPRLLERPPGGAWSAATPLPGSPAGVAGPVVDAAGNGALGIAWRVDKPRTYTGIVVAIRDPGRTLSEPIEIADAGAGGVRHPALAIDPAGDALLAYNADTSAVHLNLRGAIAIAYRTGGGSFSPPTVVDPMPSSPPAVALGPDGTGVVAWTRNRRVYVVSVDAAGRIGKVKAIASPDGVNSLVAAAGRDGAATVAWTNHRYFGTRRKPRTLYYVRALVRAAGRVFGATRVVASTAEYVRDIRVAADEDGLVTLAWSEEHFGDDRSVGNNGITSAVRTATAQVGKPFPAPRLIATPGRLYLTPPAVAAANGRVALAWRFAANRHNVGVQTAVGRAQGPGPPQTIATKTLTTGLIYSAPVIGATLRSDGAATVLYVEPVEAPNRAVAQRLLAADGR